MYEHIFVKPKDVSYTQMFIWLDDKSLNQVAMTEEEEDQAFKYLYHVIKMLAYKKRIFKRTAEYYEPFAVETAADLYMRFFKSPLGGVRSTKNYIEQVLYFQKCIWEKRNYAQVLSSDEEYIPKNQYSFNDIISQTMNDFTDSDVSIYLETVSKIIRGYLKESCYYKFDKIMYKNIYISCMLSFLNNITLTKQEQAYIVQLDKFPLAQRLFIERCYKNKNKENYIILYHLPRNMHDYIQVCINNVKRIITKDISELSECDYIESVFTALSVAEINGDAVEDYYDD